MSKKPVKTNRPKIINRVFAGFGGIAAMHPAVPIILIGLLGAFAVLMLIASVILWPVLIRGIGQPDAGSGTTLPVVIAGGVSLVVSAAASLVLAYKQEDFTFLGSLATSYVLCLVICAVGMIAGRLTVLSPIIDQTSGSGYLSFCMQLIFSLMIAMVPAFLASLIGTAFRFFGHLYWDLRD